MQWLRHRAWVRQVVIAAYALVMALLGFSHHALAAPSAPSSADLSAYALPDGSLPSLCYDDAGRRNDGTASGEACDACLLTAAGGLLPGTVALSAAAALMLQAPASGPALFRPDSRPPHVAHLRGPPVAIPPVL
ncbi:MAG: hypothetical protein JNM45_16370 [Rhizobiales bacterium]|nr:hypothetical protein [Hyphomicrobiales bacterium]